MTLTSRQRRVASGRLSAAVGDGALDIDKVMRTIGIYRSAQQSVSALSARSQATIQSFVDGINAYLDTHPPLPVEFLIFNVTPEPWTLADVVSWAKVMDWTLAGNLREELLRYELKNNRGISVR